MDEVVQLLQKLLLLLSVDLIKKTKDKLIEIGVSVEDLQLLQEQYLTDVLKPIQIRKLLQHFNAGVYLIIANALQLIIKLKLLDMVHVCMCISHSEMNIFHAFIHFI
jgi:hypothetical protein